jgi:hypothetical protein
MTRDLRADLELFNNQDNDWCVLDINMVLPEAIERAIAAENKLNELADIEGAICPEDFGFPEYCKSLQRNLNTMSAEYACLTEENGLQRASIQELSGQVAKMQVVVDAAKEIALFGAITNEKQVNSFMRKVATLGQALQNWRDKK